MGTTWTTDQLAAIESRGSNLLVSAAAGSGKTALLIERIRRIVIDEQVDVDKLLVMTFTRAAAAEMKDRLRTALIQALEDKNADRSRIIEQLNKLGCASISTLHAFCSAVIREYFQEAGIDPEFKQGNDTELNIMKQEALETVFEAQYDTLADDEENSFTRLVDRYTDNRSDEKLKALVEAFDNFLCTLPDPEAWCETMLERMALTPENFGDSLCGQEMRMLSEQQMETAQTLLETARSFCGEGFEKTAEQLEGDLASVRNARAGLKKGGVPSPGELSVTFPRYKGNKKADPETSDKIKDLRGAAKTLMAEAVAGYLNLEEDCSHIRDMQEPMKDLIVLTAQFRESYRMAKQGKNLLDFNDLERYTLKILKNDAIAAELQNRYAFVFLDEYQDTNDMQEAIVQKIVRPNNYFMVGDVKQSIYRFRLADPTIFLKKYALFGEEETDINRLITLSKNFRSCRSVIDSVNAIFEKIMSPELGEINYDHRAALYKGLNAQGPEAPTEIHIITSEPNEDTDEEIAELNKEELEARFIGAKIRQMVGEPIYNTRRDENRILRYRDIGVLMRTVSGRGEVFAKVFAEMGIPTYFEGGEQYYDSLEMTVMLNFMSLIDNKQQDLPLLSVLLSPIGGFTVSQLTTIRTEAPEHRHFYEAAQAYSENENNTLAQALKAFYDKLSYWNKASKVMDIEDFLWQLYLDTGYYDFVGVLPGGEQRQNNLRVLLKRAGDYKRSTLKGLFHFIRFVQRMKKHRYDNSPPGVLSENDDVVRIMTVHKSKGLEFPVVFLAGTSRQFNTREKNSDVLIHKDLGICPAYISLEHHARKQTLLQQMAKEKNRTELLSEEMRLLYVAMTRAEEKLIITGTVKEPEKERVKWRNPPTPFYLKKGRNQLDWLMMAIMDPLHCGFKEMEHYKFLKHPSFEVFLYTTQESVEQKEAVVQAACGEPISSLSKKVRAMLEKRLAFSPKSGLATEVPSKITVTDIKKLREDTLEKGAELPERKRRPRFMEEAVTAFTAAEKGTALHFMMQSLKLEKFRAAEKTQWKALLAEERQRLVDEALLQSELAKEIDLKKIEAFLESDGGCRLLKAQHPLREVPFNYAISPGRIRPEWSMVKEPVVVQGMIDCCFLEDNAWVLLDYKTDYYRNEGELQQLVNRYRPQLELYAEALEVLTEIPVKEKILLLITMKKMVRIG